MRLAMPAQQDVAQQPLVAGIAQVGVEIQQQVDAALVGSMDVAQDRAGVGRALGRVLAVDVQPAQTLGDRPAVQGPPDLHQALPEQVHHLRFVGTLDHDQRGIGTDQCRQVLQLTHGTGRKTKRPR
jgi:hypothetical protein